MKNIIIKRTPGKKSKARKIGKMSKQLLQKIPPQVLMGNQSGVFISHVDKYYKELNAEKELQKKKDQWRVSEIQAANELLKKEEYVKAGQQTLFVSQDLLKEQNKKLQEEKQGKTDIQKDIIQTKIDTNEQTIKDLDSSVKALGSLEKAYHYLQHFYQGSMKLLEQLQSMLEVSFSWISKKQGYIDSAENQEHIKEYVQPLSSIIFISIFYGIINLCAKIVTVSYARHLNQFTSGLVFKEEGNIGKQENLLTNIGTMINSIQEIKRVQNWIAPVVSTGLTVVVSNYLDLQHYAPFILPLQQAVSTFLQQFGNGKAFDLLSKQYLPILDKHLGQFKVNNADYSDSQMKQYESRLKTLVEQVTKKTLAQSFEKGNKILGTFQNKYDYLFDQLKQLGIFKQSASLGDTTIKYQADMSIVAQNQKQVMDSLQDIAKGMEKSFLGDITQNINKNVLGDITQGEQKMVSLDVKPLQGELVSLKKQDVPEQEAKLLKLVDKLKERQTLRQHQKEQSSGQQSLSHQKINKNQMQQLLKDRDGEEQKRQQTEEQIVLKPASRPLRQHDSDLQNRVIDQPQQGSTDIFDFSFSSIQDARLMQDPTLQKLLDGREISDVIQQIQEIVIREEYLQGYRQGRLFELLLYLAVHTPENVSSEMLWNRIDQMILDIYYFIYDSQGFQAYMGQNIPFQEIIQRMQQDFQQTLSLQQNGLSQDNDSNIRGRIYNEYVYQGLIIPSIIQGELFTSMQETESNSNFVWQNIDIEKLKQLRNILDQNYAQLIGLGTEKDYLQKGSDDLKDKCKALLKKMKYTSSEQNQNRLRSIRKVLNGIVKNIWIIDILLKLFALRQQKQ